MRVVLVVLVGLLLFLGLILVANELRVHREPPETECLNNISQIGKFLLALDANAKLKDLEGEEFLLQIRHMLKPNQMTVFRCRQDPDYETTVCSYRGPRGKGRAEHAIWAFCKHHGDGVCVLYDDGSSEYVLRSEFDELRQRGLLAELVQAANFIALDLVEKHTDYLRKVAVDRSIDQRIRELDTRITEVRTRREITIPAFRRQFEKKVVDRVEGWMRERKLGIDRDSE